MTKAPRSRYDSGSLPEAQFEPGSRGRVLNKRLISGELRAKDTENLINKATSLTPERLGELAMAVRHDAPYNLTRAH